LSRRLRVRLDAALCVGHGRCYELAPEVYGEDAEGHCRLLHAELPPGLEAAARRGVTNCPEGALEIEEG
jgi:ferredoxin